MSVKKYDSTTKLLKLIAGGTLWADCPLGTINAFGGTTAPEGWLLCQGQAISRTEYADLFAVIGTNFGAGDGSTTFNLPDMREAAPVGAGTNATNTIATHNAVNLGAFQDDQIQSHGHAISFGDSYRPVIRGSGSTELSFTAGYYGFAPGGATTTSTTGRSGTTTHGKQIGVNYIMKAKQTAMPADLKAALEAALDDKDMLVWG